MMELGGRGNIYRRGPGQEVNNMGKNNESFRMSEVCITTVRNTLRRKGWGNHNVQSMMQERGERGEHANLEDNSEE